MKNDIEKRKEDGISVNEGFPLCGWHSDCFAHRDGRCTALTDTDFRRGRCPFYATAEQYHERQLAAATSLVERDRDGLLKKYGASGRVAVSREDAFLSENESLIHDLREMAAKAKEIEDSLDVDAIWAEEAAAEDEDWE